jgi:uncharacterized protein
MDWAETDATAARARAEEPVGFAGPAGTLCGIVTPPPSDVEADSRCVILPARPRFAFHRSPVLASRILAASGFMVLRFDLRGSGESAGPSEVDNRQSPHGEDVAAAIRYVRESRGLRRFILIGYCFDALCAIDAARLEADAIAGLVCMAAPITEVAIQISPIQRLTRGIGSLGNILSRLKDPSGAVEVLRAGGKMIAAFGERPRTPRIASKFKQGLRALAESEAHALFLYGEEDPLRQELAVAERELFAQLSEEARARMKIEVWPGLVHSIEMEPAIFARAIDWVRDFGPGLKS